MPDTESHVKRGHPIFFGLLCFFAIIEGCITAWLVAKFNDSNDYPSHSVRDRLRFLVFTSWWTVFFTIFYIVFFFTASASIVASIASHAVWMFITWVFWLAAIASYTSALGGGQRCSHSDLTYCSQLVAAEAFGWIEWILLTIAFIFVILLGVGAIRRGDRLSAGLV
ncbi:hypothetical protein BCR39DRAFT_571331 [Naematelia encephala]|uniref:MARVEL domain-containing protein n=1 Tax=Naematelia encephala TaxID=71784 RepID=A0A1Y2BAA3_9TREE|nr:hypothetical protein BCR39DRAFT_571331 [Naematelia encephala]